MPEPADELLANTWVCKLPVRVEVAASSISSPVALPPFYVSPGGIIIVQADARVKS